MLDLERQTVQPSHTCCIRVGPVDGQAGRVAEGLTIGRPDARTSLRWLDEPQAICFNCRIARPTKETDHRLTCH